MLDNMDSDPSFSWTDVAEPASIWHYVVFSMPLQQFHAERRILGIWHQYLVLQRGYRVK